MRNVLLRWLLCLFMACTFLSVAAPANAVQWQPTSAQPLPLHWVLGGRLDTTNPVQMGLRDFNGKTLPAPAVYDIDGEYNTASIVSTLHAQGKKVICYFDAGVYESYRPDASKFPASVIGNPDEGWNDSRWLDVRQVSVLEPIMKARIQMCKDKGFDAVEPDEIDGWENPTGFPITYANQLTYNKAVAQWVHEAGMAVIQKGDIIQTRDLVAYFDGTLNEECWQYNECRNPYNPNTDQTQIGLQAYSNVNKPVWGAEYQAFTATKWSSICANAKSYHWNVARYKLGLPNNGGRMPCATTSSTAW